MTRRNYYTLFTATTNLILIMGFNLENYTYFESLFRLINSDKKLVAED